MSMEDKKTPFYQMRGGVFLWQELVSLLIKQFQIGFESAPAKRLAERFSDV